MLALIQTNAATYAKPRWDSLRRVPTGHYMHGGGLRVRVCYGVRNIVASAS